MQHMIHRLKRRPMAEINVVPYIDVMLVLLVIFMITAPLLEQGVQIELPNTVSEPLPTQNDKPLILSVDYQGLYYLNSEKTSQPLNREAVVHQVLQTLQKAPHTQVLVRGDQRVHYGKVVQAMAWLQQAGVNRIGLMTESVADQ